MAKKEGGGSSGLVPILLIGGVLVVAFIFKDQIMGAISAPSSGAGNVSGGAPSAPTPPAAPQQRTREKSLARMQARLDEVKARKQNKIAQRRPQAQAQLAFSNLG